MGVRIFPVIMSGGSGTRLWPLSTEAHPKQFHALASARSMIEETALRLSGQHGDIEFLPPIIIASARHRDVMNRALAASNIKPAAVILEPIGRNTAATAALGAIVSQQLDPEALVLLMPADHVVTDPKAFVSAISKAAAFAHNRIVTFGISPTEPNTGYGYIEQGAALSDCVYEVAAFKEKPEQKLAEDYIRRGNFSWNSGVFFFSPRTMLEEFAAAAPDIATGAAAALEKGARSGIETVLDEALFKAVRSEPVDIAIMEKTTRAAVATCSIGWADIGSWAELWRLSQQDAGGNAVTGSVLTRDASNNLVRAEGIHVSIAGVSDLIVVATKDHVLIIPRERSQEVKNLIPKG